MKTAKKQLALCLAALMLLLVFTGCHGSRGLEAFEIPESFDTDRPLEITFWAKNDTNKTQTAIYNRAIEEFEKLYPNVKVNIRLYTDYGRIYNDVITNISTGTTPNVCITYPDHIATYLTGPNVVVPLDALFADPSWGFGGSELRFDGPGPDEMIGKFLDECAIGGEHYAVPFMRSTLTFCQGPWGLVHPCAMPDAASHSSNGRERHPGPLSVITRPTSTPRPR